MVLVGAPRGGGLVKGGGGEVEGEQGGGGFGGEGEDAR